LQSEHKDKNESKDNESRNDLHNINSYRDAIQNLTHVTTKTLEIRLKKIEEYLTAQNDILKEYNDTVHHLQSKSLRNLYLLVSLIILMIIVALKS